MTAEPSSLNDLRSDGIRLETFDLSTVPPERLVAMIADLANRATAEKARADRLETERDEATKRAETAEAEVAAVIEWAGERKGWPDLKTKMDLLVRGANQAEADAQVAEARADRLGVERDEARVDVERLTSELDRAAQALESIRDLAPHHPSDKLLPIAEIGAHFARAALTSPEGDKS